MKKESSRNLKNRGLSENNPLPNIVRIESLTKVARERYLKGLNTIRDIGRTGKGNDKEVFYGFTSADSKTNGFQLSSDWAKSGNGMGVLGAVKGLAKSGSKLPGVGGILNFANSALDIGVGLADAATGLTGTDYKSIGGATIKDYKGTNLKGFSVSCGWYLPEQYKTCVKSVSQLIKMAYPKSASASDISNGVIKALDTIKNSTVNLFTDANSTEPTSKDVSGEPGVVKSYIDKAGDGVASLFGFDLTFDPIPVRVSMGDYIDIEPLVITSIQLDYSKDLYIQPNGKFMPLFCTVTIGFDFWMNPSPDLEFLKVLGQEMIGTDEFDLSGVE
jgi:hypothetical protein